MTKNEIISILSAKAEAPKPASTVTFMAIVKPAKSKDNFAVCVGNTMNWHDLPVSDIEYVEDVDVVQVDNAYYKLVLLTVKRPSTNNMWFDFFADAVQTNSGLLADADDSDCGCGCAGNEPPPGAHKRAGRRPTTQAKGYCTHCKLINNNWWCWTNPFCS